MGEAFRSVTGQVPGNLGEAGLWLQGKGPAQPNAPAPPPPSPSISAPAGPAPEPNQRTMGYAPTSAPGTPGGARVLPRGGLMRTLGGATV